MPLPIFRTSYRQSLPEVPARAPQLYETQIASISSNT